MEVGLSPPPPTSMAPLLTYHPPLPGVGGSLAGFRRPLIVPRQEESTERGREFQTKVMPVLQIINDKLERC